MSVNNAALSGQFKWQIIQQALIFFLFPAFLLIAVGLYHYHDITESDREGLMVKEKINTELGQIAITNALQGVISDLMYLSRQYEIHNKNAGDDTTLIPSLADEYLLFSNEMGIYNQIRLLDETGVERIRVNHNRGRSSIVPEHLLQDKSDRYYFKNAWLLERGEVYISPFDLNIEHRQIEEPIEPVIRFAAPVFGADGHKTGILILNYLGKKLLNDFRNAVVNIADHAMLVNADGYWLSSPIKEDEWGFMYGNSKTFVKLYPEIWALMKDSDSGQIERSDGIYSFTTIYPLQSTIDIRSYKAANFDGNTWKVISRLPVRFLANDSRFSQYVNIYTLMFILLAACAYTLAYVQAKHRSAVEQIEFEQRFRETLENIKLLAIGLSKEGKIIFCNDTLLELVGRTREEVLGINWFDHFIPENKRDIEKQYFIQSMEEQHSLHQVEADVLDKHNQHRLVEWNSSVMLDNNGEVNGLTCIGKDITVARHAEEELHKIMRAIEQSPSTVMIVDTVGRIEYVNPKFTEITGYTLEEVVGQNPRILKSGETSNDEYKELWETIAAGEEWRGVLHNRKKNGELYWEEALISPVRNAEDEITHFLAVKEDITERIRLEDEVDKRNREIARNEALTAVGRMANMIAHDLRNPLSSIKMGLQILGDKPATAWQEEEHELKQIALDQVAYMEDILADLMSFSRPDALNPEWLKLNELLDTVLIQMQKEILEHHVQIETVYESGLPNIYADARKLRQVFTNIISNGVQATEGLDNRIPEISIRIKQLMSADIPEVCIEITDNGQGLESETETRLFEPFFTTRSKGTGLGLAIVNRFVEQHNGTVSLGPADHVGTKVVVVLPTEAIDNKQIENDENKPTSEKVSASV
jgi:PAS domain S-box-containing protein